ncbi:MAG: MerR family DNA-binding transcriptional regulator [Candidatus Harrisonbacteria bacterium CG10_big_fil_rev_8_21_14_0_10_45_28]|uniref:MerR family DNA-binding transcriptional regulator n=1 Tax=Candidatus Harrisonbacteria bacterium CG10_big_fil_rev_8_21_14_0_10_45_28 TaxID=1974586 RepID=A0A2H0UMH4_9BACT|nr:MAG: MerR family DNA-binding transcriptional regulator [Candidatus Harrisonbacteria bacterium CG10_big_fil_rev_8_21_14_0_10_45_28]
MAKEKEQNLPELLSITEIAKLLGVSTMTLRRWDTKGILKSFRPTPSSQRRYRRSDVAKFLGSKK